MQYAKEVARNSLQGAKSHIPAILAVSGAFSLAAGFSVKLFIETPPTWQELASQFLIIAGQATLVSGVYAAVSNSEQLVKIIKKSLGDFLATEEYLSKRKDIEVVWKQAYKALHHDKFPLISEKLADVILDAHRIEDKDFYYDAYKRTLTLEWESKSKKRVKLIDEMNMDINPSRESNKGVYRWIWESKSDLFSRTLKVETFKIAGREYNREVKPKDITPPGGPKREGYVLSAELSDLQKYPVERLMIAGYEIDDDPVWVFKAPTFVLGMDVIVQCLPDDLRVEFRPFGMAEKFEESRKGIKPLGRQSDWHMRHSGLILPQQGFMLVVRRA